MAHGLSHTIGAGASPRRHDTGLARFVRRALSELRARREAARLYYCLEQFDDHLLHDIGFSSRTALWSQVLDSVRRHRR